MDFLKNKINIYVIICILLILASIIYISSVFRFNNTPQSNPQNYKEKDKAYYDNSKYDPLNPQKDDADVFDNIEKYDIKVGTGEEIKSGDNIKINYKAMLTDGKIVDSSYTDGREPFIVRDLGHAPVIEAWNQALIGMKVGGTRKIYSPADLAYGKEGNGESIPPNSTLVFEVEVLEKLQP